MVLLDLYQKAKKKLYDTFSPVEQKVSSGLGAAANSIRNTLNSPAPQWMQSVDQGLRSFSNAAENVPKFNFARKVKNPVGRFGAEIVQGVANIPSKTVSTVFKDYGKVNTEPSYLVKRGAEAANIGVDIGSLFAGGPVVKNLAKGGLEKAGKATLKQVFKQGAKAGAKQGLAYGSTSGALSGLQEGNNLKEQGKNALKQGTIGGAMGLAAGGVLGGAIPAVGHEAGSIKRDVKNLMNPYVKRVVRKVDYEPVPGVFAGPNGENSMREIPDTARKVVKTVKMPFKPESMTGKLLSARPGMNIENVNMKKPVVVSSKELDSKIAQKNAKAKDLVNRQINSQKAGLNTAESGFVAPNNIENKSKVKYRIVKNKPVEDVPFKGDEFSKDKNLSPIKNNIINKIKPEWRTDYAMVQDDIKKIIKEEADYMMSLKGQVGEVGIYKKIGEGNVGGDTGLRRFTSNPEWYRDFFDKNGRAPRKWEIEKIAEANLKNGKGMFIDEYNNLQKTRFEIEKASMQGTAEFNKFQQRAYEKKGERLNDIGEIMNYPKDLRAGGYRKPEIERMGVDEVKKKAKLLRLGYPKNEIQKYDFDRMDLIIKRQVPYQTLKSYYQKKNALNTNFLEGIDPTELKDINPLMTGGRDVYRNFEATFGKNYPKLKSKLLDPFDQAKGNFITEQQTQLKELEENIVKRFGITKGSKMSEYVQKWGENKYIRPLQEADIPENIKLQINLSELKSLAEKTKGDWRILAMKKLEEMPNEKRQIVLSQLKQAEPKKWQSVIEADKWFRSKYESLLGELNKVREENFPTHPLYPEGTKIIPYRKDYYRHFKEANGLTGLKNLFEGPSNIDPALAASSDVTNPKTKWLSFAQKRKGDQTEYDAVGGFLDYLKNHSYAKHVDPFIQKFKGIDEEAKDLLPNSAMKFEKPRIGLSEELSQKMDPIQQMADSTDPAVIKKVLTDHGMSEAQSEWMSKELSGIKDYQKVIDFIKNKTSKNKENILGKMEPKAAAEGSDNKLNNFLVFVKNFSRDLAGKTNPMDRGIQENFMGRKVMNAMSWVNSRFKANAVLGNASSTLAQFFNIPQGFASAGARNSAKGLGDSLASIFKETTPIQKSSFIRERYFKDYNKFDTGMFDNVKKFAVWMTGFGDEIGTKFIWNSHYRKALSEGIPNPIKYADDLTRKMVAGRGIGEVPIVQKSKIIQMVAPFQLEVANQWYALNDLFKNNPNKAVIAKKLLEFSVASYLMNRVVKEIRGSDVSFDPLNALAEAYNEYQTEDNKLKGSLKAGGRVVGELFSNMPGGQTIASIYPETGEVMGSKILPNRKDFFGEGDPTRFGTGAAPMFSAVKNPITGVILPYGGKQLEKTYGGAKALLKGYTENSSGNVMTPVKRNVSNFLRGLLFGKSAMNEMQDYYNNDQRPLSPEQTEKFKLTGNEYFDRVAAERKSEKEKAGLKVGKTLGESKQLSDDIYQLSNGKFYAKPLNSEFETAEKAEREIIKEEFRKSDNNFMDLGNRVLRKTEDGTVSDISKSKFNSMLYGAQLILFKKNDDLEGWNKVADQQFKLLNEMMFDPSIDELEKVEIQSKLETLSDDYLKYKDYGGFKNGSKGKATKPASYYENPDTDPVFLAIARMRAFGKNPSKFKIGKRMPGLSNRRINSAARKKMRLISLKLK